MSTSVRVSPFTMMKVPASSSGSKLAVARRPIRAPVVPTSTEFACPGRCRRRRRVMVCGRWCRFSTASSIPEARSWRRIRRTIGSPPTGMAALARTNERGAGWRGRRSGRAPESFLVKHHVRSVDSVGGAVRHEQAAYESRIKSPGDRPRARVISLNALLPSISTNVPTGVSSSAMVTSSAAYSSRTSRSGRRRAVRAVRTRAGGSRRRR